MIKEHYNSICLSHCISLSILIVIDEKICAQRVNITHSLLHSWLVGKSTFVSQLSRLEAFPLCLTGHNVFQCFCFPSFGGKSICHLSKWTFMLFQIIRMLNSDEIACQEMLLLQTFIRKVFWMRDLNISSSESVQAF